MVKKNITHSFPSYSDNQCKAIIRQFYHHFCDVLVEILYGGYASQEDMRERVVFDNIEEVCADAIKYRGVVFMVAHYGNWEWLADVQDRMNQCVPDANIEECNVYRRLRSSFFDCIMQKIRQKRGGTYIDKHYLYRNIVHRWEANQLSTYGMVSDQKARIDKRNYTCIFLNQTTHFLLGAETIARKFNFPVYYVHMRQVRRGYYHIDTQLISRESRQTEAFAITSAYAKKLERDIRQHPSLWLWSHNRWKWT